MSNRTLLGLLTPSSNTTLEPVSTRMLLTIFCANLAGAPIVEAMEEEPGAPVCDSIATVVWKSLRMVGADTRRMARWGRLFRDLP